ncbi:MAG: LysR family transcriptional regulator [Oligoflexia bacterium]|nr:LysR family transcriptional regulator [Oligoflexia bacterium]
MNITIDQAAAFAAVAKEGTFQKAAKRLGKGHSAVMYSVKQLEEELQLKLFDRTGYRSALTSEGLLILKYCKKLLNTTEEITHVCRKLKGGWEPRVSLVYDGVIDFNTISDVLLKINKDDIPTEIKVASAHLDEVEKRFDQEDADMMLTILPNQQQKNPSIQLKSLKVLLVASKDFPLSKEKKKISVSELNNFTYIGVRGSTAGIGLSTEQIELKSIFIVNDFYTKKQAILKKLGYGWLPDYMVSQELRKKTLCVLNTEIANQHILYPRLYHKFEDSLGRAAEALLKAFSAY